MVFPILRKLLATVIVRFSHLSMVQIFITDAMNIVVFVQFTTESESAAASM